MSAAGAVILAVDIAVQDMDRFQGMRLIEVSVQEAIRNPEAVIARAVQG